MMRVKIERSHVYSTDERWEVTVEIDKPNHVRVYKRHVTIGTCAGGEQERAGILANQLATIARVIGIDEKTGTEKA